MIYELYYFILLLHKKVNITNAMIYQVSYHIIISLPLTLPVLSAIMNYVPGDEMYSVLLPEIK